MADHIAKAEEFGRKAEKKLGGWGLFGSKYEDASELYAKSANHFKLAKSCIFLSLYNSSSSLSKSAISWLIYQFLLISVNYDFDRSFLNCWFIVWIQGIELVRFSSNCLIVIWRWLIFVCFVCFVSIHFLSKVYNFIWKINISMCSHISCQNVYLFIGKWLLVSYYERKSHDTS